MKEELNEEIYAYLREDDSEEISSLLRSWDKGDCSTYGLVNILMIKECKDHVKENGDYAEEDARKMLDFCLSWRKGR